MSGTARFAPMLTSPTHSGSGPGGPRFQLVVAFACIYIVWGSTYLAIRYGVETIPPFAMAGTRFLLAGGILYAWLAIRGEACRATAAQWRAAAVSGGLFFLGGNGGVCWAEQRVPSGIAALIVASMPLWIALLDWLGPAGKRPTLPTVAGIALGFLGVAILIGPVQVSGAAVDPAGALVLLVASISWAAGTIYTRHAPRLGNHLQSTAMQMLAGGILLCVAGAAHGDWARLDLSTVTLRSMASVAYLALFGSILAFSAYNWLVHATTPARISTYAYVNPAIAVALGWAFAGEPISPRVLLAGATIVAGVAMILAVPSTSRSRGKTDS